MTKSQHRRARDAQRILGTASQPINGHTMSYVEPDKKQKRAQSGEDRAPLEFIPAATYVPTQLPVQYHRPGEA